MDTDTVTDMVTDTAATAATAMMENIKQFLMNIRLGEWINWTQEVTLRKIRTYLIDQNRKVNFILSKTNNFFSFLCRTFNVFRYFEELNCCVHSSLLWWSSKNEKKKNLKICINTYGSIKMCWTIRGKREQDLERTILWRHNMEELRWQPQLRHVNITGSVLQCVSCLFVLWLFWNKRWMFSQKAHFLA